MTWQRSFHHFVRPLAWSNELRQFFLGVFLYRLGAGLVSLAAPLYLFQVGQNFEWLQFLTLTPFETGLLFILMFLLIERLIVLLISAPLAKIIPKIGFQWSLVIGMGLFASRLLLYEWIAKIPSVALIAVGVGACAISFFWLSYHTYFATESHLKRLGEEVGSIEFLSRFAHIITPLLGAILANNFGYTFTLWLGAGLYIAAASSFLQLPPIRTKIQWTWSLYWNWIRQPVQRNLSLAIAAYTWEDLGILFFWPIFLFVTFDTITAVGYIITSASILSLLFVYFTGWAIDHRAKDKNLYHRVSGSIVSFLWIPRMIWGQFPSLLILNDAVDRLSHSVYSTIFQTNLLRHSRQQKVFQFFVHRQVTIAIVWIILLILTILLLFWNWSWPALFASFMVAGFFSLRYKPNKISK